MQQRHLREKYGGTRLGRQEMDAELLADLEGALWNRALIDECRIKRGDQPERLRRVVVAVDPPGGASKANAECGIIVAALGADRHGYVLADLSGRLSPEQWARRVVEAYQGYKADKIVAEQNFGGAMVESTIRSIDSRVPIKMVVASRGKQIRDEKPPIQELYAKLTQDSARNDLIFDDILSALEAGRSPVVITERKDHLEMLAGRLSKFAKNVVVLRGGMSAQRTRAASDTLRDISDGEERVLVTTGRYLGEGFDDARLDTLFLTMPISWRGTLAQYAGRLHRLHAPKRDLVIYDYVDENEPMLAKMATKRELGYRSLGYRAVRSAELDLKWRSREPA
jgi:hypothetical protein